MFVKASQRFHTNTDNVVLASAAAWLTSHFGSSHFGSSRFSQIGCDAVSRPLLEVSFVPIETSCDGAQGMTQRRVVPSMVAVVDGSTATISAMASFTPTSAVEGIRQRSRSQSAPNSEVPVPQFPRHGPGEVGQVGGDTGACGSQCGQGQAFGDCQASSGRRSFQMLRQRHWHIMVLFGNSV